MIELFKRSSTTGKKEALKVPVQRLYKVGSNGPKHRLATYMWKTHTTNEKEERDILATNSDQYPKGKSGILVKVAELCSVISIKMEMSDFLSKDRRKIGDVIPLLGVNEIMRGLLYGLQV